MQKQRQKLQPHPRQFQMPAIEAVKTLEEILEAQKQRKNLTTGRKNSAVLDLILSAK